MITPRAAEGHSTLSPYVIVSDARTAIGFVESLFGARVVLKHERPNGSIMHASIGIGDSTLMIADPVEGYPAAPASIHIYVDDVDATFHQAIHVGANAIQEPSEKGDGDRRAGFKHASGITFWIATHMN